eukprot:jgi/Bigna1/70608/fgenesh1_pg.12_\
MALDALFLSLLFFPLPLLRSCPCPCSPPRGLTLVGKKGLRKPLANSPLGTQPPPLQMDVAQQPDSSSKEKLFLFFEEPFFSKPKSYLVVGKVVGDAKKRILTSTSKRELKTVQGLPISPEAKVLESTHTDGTAANDISIELELLAKPEGGDDEKEGKLHGTESVMVLSEKLAEMMKDPGKKVLMGTVKFKSSHGVSILNLSASYGKQAEAAASALAIPKKLISLRIDAISKDKSLSIRLPEEGPCS